MDVQALKSAASGKWHGIVSHFGIDVPEDPKKHTACPCCGGKDRFRFDNKDGSGSFFCNQCGAGPDGIALIQRAIGLTFPETMSRIAEVVGAVEERFDDKPKSDPRKRLNELWKSSLSLDGADPVSKYLYSRKLIMRPRDVRYCPKCYEPETKKEMPAMIARVTGPDGKPVTLHRTYLDGEKKADLESPKKLMPGVTKLAGAAIRLFSVATDTLGVAEGIETAIACFQLFGIPTWATVSSSLMESFVPPPEARRIVIFADCDSNFTGQKSAYRLANRLYAKDLVVEVQVPAIGDYADEVERLPV